MFLISILVIFLLVDDVEDICNAGSGQLLFVFFARLVMIFREDMVAAAGDYMVTSYTDTFP